MQLLCSHVSEVLSSRGTLEPGGFDFGKMSGKKEFKIPTLD